VRTFPHISATLVNALHCSRIKVASISKTFPWSLEPGGRKAAPTLRPLQRTGPIMLTDRARAGFSGIFAVTAILLVVQLITGVQAFPL
jgi:hypothetical protein